MNTPDTQPPTAWPEGVIARYPTVGGAFVDIRHDTLYVDDVEPNVTFARCGGCGVHYSVLWAEDEGPWTWAQSHAESCRAVPRPDGHTS